MFRTADSLSRASNPVQTTTRANTPATATPTAATTASPVAVPSDQAAISTTQPQIAALDYGDPPFDITAPVSPEVYDAWIYTHLSRQRSEALGRMTPEQREQYEQVSRAMEEAGETEGLLALERMLLDPDQPLLQGDLLQSLARVATEPKAQGMVNKLGAEGLGARMVSELIRQIETPGLIAQSGAYDTCGEACMEFYLAATDPVGYARLVADLSSSSVLAHWNGERIFGSTVGFDSLGDGRSLVSNLFQHSWHTTYTNPDNADGVKVARYAQAVEKMSPDVDFVTFAPEHAQAAIEQLQPATIVLLPAPGAPEGESHAMVFQGYDSAKGRVVLFDPLEGTSISMTPAEFADSLQGAALPKGHGIPEADLQLDVGYSNRRITAPGSSS
jgi:hypothetical protein